MLSEIESEAAIKSSVKSSVGMDERKLAAKPYTNGMVIELTDKEKRATNKKIKEEVLQKIPQFKAVLSMPNAFGPEHWKEFISQMKNNGDYTNQLFFGQSRDSQSWRAKILAKARAKLEIGIIWANVEDPPIVQAAAGIPNAVQVQAGAALAPNIHVPVLPGIVGTANARAQAIANRHNLAAAAGNNRPPTVVDQEDVANMRRPRNRDNVETHDSMQRSILQANNALTRAMEGRAQPPPPPALQPLPTITPLPLRQEELGEQINSLYKRLKVAREMGMEDSAVRCERQIADLETRDEELTRKRFLNNN
jgi:hypothetical protein